MTKRSADALQGLDAIISPAGVQYGSSNKLDDEVHIQMLGSGESLVFTGNRVNVTDKFRYFRPRSRALLLCH